MFYSGIDLHRDNCFITTVDDSGVIVKQQRVPNTPPLVHDYFTTLGAEHRMNASIRPTHNDAGKSSIHVPACS